MSTVKTVKMSNALGNNVSLHDLLGMHNCTTDNKFVRIDNTYHEFYDVEIKDITEETIHASDTERLELTVSFSQFKDSRFKEMVTDDDDESEKIYDKVWISNPIDPYVLVHYSTFPIRIVIKKQNKEKTSNEVYLKVKYRYSPDNKYNHISDIEEIYKKYGNQIMITYSKETDTFKVFWCLSETAEFRKYINQKRKEYIKCIKDNNERRNIYLEQKRIEEELRKEELERKKEKQRELRRYLRDMRNGEIVDYYNRMDKRWHSGKEYSECFSSDIIEAIEEAGFDTSNLVF